jgi:hypothetical protein
MIHPVGGQMDDDTNLQLFRTNNEPMNHTQIMNTS